MAHATHLTSVTWQILDIHWEKCQISSSHIIFSPGSCMKKANRVDFDLMLTWIFCFAISFFFSRNPGCLLVWRRSLPRPRRSWQGKNRSRYDVLPTPGRVPDPVSPNISLFVVSVNRWKALNLWTSISCTRENTEKYLFRYLIQLFIWSIFLLTLNSYQFYLTSLHARKLCD